MSWYLRSVVLNIDMLVFLCSISQLFIHLIKFFWDMYKLSNNFFVKLFSNLFTLFLIFNIELLLSYIFNMCFKKFLCVFIIFWSLFGLFIILMLIQLFFKYLCISIFHFFVIKLTSVFVFINLFILVWLAFLFVFILLVRLFIIFLIWLEIFFFCFSLTLFFNFVKIIY